MPVWVPDFIANISLLVILSIGVAYLEPKAGKVASEAVRQATRGLLFGLVIVWVMIDPIIKETGATFDPRGGPAILAGFYGGPLGALVAGAIGAATRYYVVGGPVALGGAVGFLLYGLFGMGCWRLLARRGVRLGPAGFAGIGLTGTLAVLPAFFVSVDVSTALSIIVDAGPLLAINTTLSTVVVGMSIEFARRHAQMRQDLTSGNRENRQLSLLLRKTTNIVIVTDREGLIEWVNDAFVRATGFDFEDAIGRKPGALLQGPDTDPETVKEMSRCVRDGEGFHVEVLNYRKDGTPIWLDIDCQLVNEPDLGRKFVAIEQDITDRKLAVERAKRAEKRLITAIESINDAFVLYDSDDRLVIANRRFKEFYPHLADVFEPGRLFEDIVREIVGRGHYTAAFGRIDDWLAERMKAHRLGNRDDIRQLEDGRWLRISERKTLDGGRADLRVDITDLKSAHDAAEAANRAKSAFLATMSHEIRTPLTGLLGMADLLELTDLDDKQAHFIRTLKTSGRHLEAILNDILDLSKLEANKLELDVEPFEIGQMVETAESVYGSVATSKGLAFTVTVDSALRGFVLHGDLIRLRQILMNLIGNAVKFTQSGSIRFEARRSDTFEGGQGLSITVTDTGIGIPEDQIAQVFDPFMQGDDHRRRSTGGTGLGLAICRRLVDKMDGHMAVDSEPGRGSVFAVDVPLRITEAEPVRVPEEPAERPAAGPIGGSSGLRVLIVDDNVVNRDLIANMLKVWGSYDIDSAEDGEIALGKLRNEPYDLVLLDIHMPRMDGREVLKRWNRDRSQGRTRVLAFTADVMVESMDEYRALGFDGVLAKPIDWKALKGFVEETEARGLDHPVDARLSG